MFLIQFVATREHLAWKMAPSAEDITSPLSLVEVEARYLSSKQMYRLWMETILCFSSQN